MPARLLVWIAPSPSKCGQILSKPDRESKISPIINGIGRCASSVLLGGYVRSTIGPIGFRIDAGQDIANGHDGLTADVSIGTFYRVRTRGNTTTSISPPQLSRLPSRFRWGH